MSKSALKNFSASQIRSNRVIAVRRDLANKKSLQERERVNRGATVVVRSVGRLGDFLTKSSDAVRKDIPKPSKDRVEKIVKSQKGGSLKW